VESKLVLDSTKVSDLPIGVPDPKLLEQEVNTYAEIGLFDAQVPDITSILDEALVKALYDDNAKIIWPAA
jgi:hypothetical protein